MMKREIYSLMGMDTGCRCRQFVSVNAANGLVRSPEAE